MMDPNTERRLQIIGQELPKNILNKLLNKNKNPEAAKKAMKEADLYYETKVKQALRDKQIKKFESDSFTKEMLYKTNKK